MSLSVVKTRAQLGIEAPEVSVEVHISGGLPSLNIVGLPETAVRESKERVRSALINSHFEFPTRRITINLAPADLPKEGGRYDLPIALGILAASNQIPAESLNNIEFLGELALSGDIRPVKGVLPAAINCEQKQRTLYIPLENQTEAALVENLECFPFDNLLNVCAHLKGAIECPKAQVIAKPHGDDSSHNLNQLDLSDVKGQQQAKRALTIAAAGQHNLLYFGPPGTGKTLLAKRMPTILPRLTNAESLAVASVYSVAGTTRPAWGEPPIRSPHNTASTTAIVGGGTHPKPGEISLSHHGILFLDEFAEFPRSALEVLRDPLESGLIHISRANQQVAYPARFQLLAAMNPCPCGYLHSQRCRCTPDQIRRYRNKISGPILDRIDLQVAVGMINPSELKNMSGGETSEQVRAKVVAARDRQQTRQGCTNANLSSKQLDNICKLGNSESLLLERAIEKLGLSARAYHRTIKVARTIADLAQSEDIKKEHVMEALTYRQLEKQSANSQTG
ncbi:YifB family Mg chelatase-like AAA ATPase [Sessilibacter corallicola]|uniref:YifB family Mg chelatase-like AAA ATPase n=1 Tax=Sessilibacter corallicola TaxID=2904075 RepID=A0ABQ0A5T0_9GAMM